MVADIIKGGLKIVAGFINAYKLSYKDFFLSSVAVKLACLIVWFCLTCYHPHC